jgi:hypothetical protein
VLEAQWVPRLDFNHSAEMMHWCSSPRLLAKVGNSLGKKRGDDSRRLAGLLFASQQRRLFQVRS